MQSKFLKFTFIFISSCLISLPAGATKPYSTQCLLAGPIPVNQLSSTEVFSCNVINLASSNPTHTSILVCGTDGDYDNCLVTLYLAFETADSIQRSTSDHPNEQMMFCEVSYLGSPGELTGTACISDPVIGSQTCVQLQERLCVNL